MTGSTRSVNYDPSPMLPRRTASPQSRRIRAPRRRVHGSRLPPQPDLVRWLTAPGSLTARLRRHGQVTVEVLAQGRRRLWPQERRALGCAAGHVREVVLRVGGRPAVWARSSVPLRAVKGPWRAIKGLGTRPLAELLFSHHRVHRGPLRVTHLPACGPAHHHLERQWSRLESGVEASPPPCWARHSLFRHHGQPLQVLEAFSPWVAKLLCVAP